MSGVLYVLDEPSIGLHPRDNHRLLSTLTKLRDMGNSIIVVEHDTETMVNADHIIDLGPEGGIEGGYVMANGTPEEVAAITKSYTGQLLRGLLSS